MFHLCSGVPESTWGSSPALRLVRQVSVFLLGVDSRCAHCVDLLQCPDVRCEAEEGVIGCGESGRLYMIFLLLFCFYAIQS
jgi:hypothetical protein